nr:hypothetical protein [Streptomyces fradiae]
MHAAPAVREALLHEGCGNPSLLTDLVAGLTPAQLTGAAPLPEPLPADGPLLRDGAARLRALPPDTRLLLLLAAAAHECAGPGAGIGADLLLGAARRAGLAGAALEPAETAGVVRTEGDRVRFAHPTLRRVAYGGEPLARRRAAHALLAEVLAARGEAYRLRALRHRAAATEQPDPDLADRLAAAAAAAPARPTPTANGPPPWPGPPSSPSPPTPGSPGSPPRPSTPGSRAVPTGRAPCSRRAVNCPRGRPYGAGPNWCAASSNCGTAWSPTPARSCCTRPGCWNRTTGRGPAVPCCTRRRRPGPTATWPGTSPTSAGPRP